LAVHGDVRIEAIREGTRPGAFQWRNHRRVQAACEEIALQVDEKRLPLAAARKRVGNDVELAHRRSVNAGFVGQETLFGDPPIVGLDRRAVFLQPAFFALGADNHVQAPFECLRQIDAQTPCCVEQLGIDEEIDRPLFGYTLVEHGRLLSAQY